MRIVITEEQNRKLFIPRKLSDNVSRYSDWNNSQKIVMVIELINMIVKEGNRVIGKNIGIMVL